MAETSTTLPIHFNQWLMRYTAGRYLGRPASSCDIPWVRATLAMGILALVLAFASGAHGQPAGVQTLAGSATDKAKSSRDGIGAAARFEWPMGIAVDESGTVYVTDTYQHLIRKITPQGVVSTLAGGLSLAGSQDGPGPQARFNHPAGIAVDKSGVLYVADADNHAIRRITPAGEVTTLAGLAGAKGSADGAAGAARFNTPHGVATSPDGSLYVVDTYNHTIRKIAPTGEVTTLAGLAGAKGSADGPGGQARFFHPSGVAVAADGTVYVADDSNQTIRKITAAGMVTTLAGAPRRKGFAEGQGPAARFHAPTSLVVSATGQVYVADYINSVIREVSPQGQVSTFAGVYKGWGNLDGSRSEARFKFPFGVAVGPNGWLYVADSGNRTIRIIR